MFIVTLAELLKVVIDTDDKESSHRIVLVEFSLCLSSHIDNIYHVYQVENYNEDSSNDILSNA